MTQPSFFAELKRRNVWRAAAFYAAGAWLVAQVAGLVLPIYQVEAWVLRWIVSALVVGFPFWLLFAWFYEITPEGIKRESEIEAHESITAHTGKRMDRWIIAILSLAVVLLLTDRFVLEREPGDGGPINEKSVAVLPLANTSGDPDNEYFSDGMSEELINTLGKVRDLTVIGRNSSFQFKGKTGDTKAIAAKLGVAYVLEGSVRKAQDRVRIAVGLVQAADGANVWSETYDRELKDIFAVQSEIATAVATQLRSALLGASAAKLASDAPPSGSVEAHNAFLLGRFYQARSTEADFRKAIEQFTRATALDARYALAWSSLSRALSSLAIQHLEGATQRETFEQARSASDRALALAPDLISAHTWRGYLLLNADFDLRGAEAALRRAVELEPDDGDANFQLGVLLATTGRAQVAVDLTQRALVTDPLNDRWYGWLGLYLTALDRLDEAAAATRRAIELQPDSVANFAQLAIVELLRGDAAAALAEARREPEGWWREYAVALALQIGPDRAGADAALAAFIEKHASLAVYQIAQVYAVRGEQDKMFEWLERAHAAHDPGIQYLHFDPLVLRFKADPRLVAFCRKVGLPTPEEVAAAAAQDKPKA